MAEKNRLQELAYNGFVLVIDYLVVTAIILFMWSIRTEAAPLWSNLDPFTRRFTVVTGLVTILAIAAGGGYRNSLWTPPGRQLVYLVKGFILSGMVIPVWLWNSARAAPLASPVAFGGLSLLSLFLVRFVLGEVRERLVAAGWGRRRALVFGSGQDACLLGERIRTSGWLPYRLCGYLEVTETATGGSGERWRVPMADLDAFLSRYRGGVLITPLEPGGEQLPEAVVDACRRAAVAVRRVPSPARLRIGEGQVADLLGVPVIVKDRRFHQVNERIKRVMDLVLGGAALAVLSPVFAAIAAAIKLDDPGPVFYRQTRLTRHGRHFKMYKFRSMVVDADSRLDEVRDLNEADGPIFKIRRDPRVTAVGEFLRKTSLDELPQLFNVLRGELSLVGPRPPIPQEVENYQPWQLRRLDVVQGMTGLWQVSGRSRLSFEEMVLLDLYYIDHWSIGLDLELLIETVPTVLLGKGAY
ncbi:sugar transferase [bacterium]|nr:sugar transferase [candidate division CSSED10-310 bacterium]